MAKNALGRGLGALLGDKPGGRPSSPSPGTPSPQDGGPGDDSKSVRHVSLSRIQPCSFQPRKDFTQESLQELAAQQSAGDMATAAS